MLSVVLAAATAGSAAAPRSTVIDVFPGPNAIAKAIHRASAGDTLRIHRGTYDEALTVDKPLTLQGVRKGRHPLIDAGCKANDAIHVTSGGVTIQGLTVKGAASGFGDYPAEIFFERTRTGRVMDDRVVDTCDAEYGISVLDTGPMVIRYNEARGFDDSGIYVGSIADTLGKEIRVADNQATKNSRGIIIEDSNSAKAHIRVYHNELIDNRIAGDEGPSDGLYLTNSDHVKIVGNQSNVNAGSGYHANKSSDSNVFKDNIAGGDDAGKLLDEGHGNCGSGNNFPIPAC